LKFSLLIETKARGKRLGLFCGQHFRALQWPPRFHLDSGIGIDWPLVAIAIPNFVHAHAGSAAVDSRNHFH